MPSNRFVEPACNEQALFRSCASTDSRAHQYSELAKARAQVVSYSRGSKNGRACVALDETGCLHEMVGGVDPSRLRDRARTQEHEPGASGTPRCCFKAGAKGLRRGQESTPCDIGNLGRGVS